MDILAGWKSIIAAAGFVVVAYVDWTKSDQAGAFQALMSALAIFGIHAAVVRNGK
jgi:hypothetical protein